MEGSVPSKCNLNTYHLTIIIRDTDFIRMVLVSMMTAVTLVTYWKKMRFLKVGETFNVLMEIGQILSRLKKCEITTRFKLKPFFRLSVRK